MAGKNQVIVKDNHGHKTKVHRRDLKVIDSDAKVVEMYKELRKVGRRDAPHCIPVKQIPNLEWEKEQAEPPCIEKNPSKAAERNTGPTLRSSKNKQKLDEIQEVEENTAQDKEQIWTGFLSVTMIVVGLYTMAAQIINTHLF